MLRDGGVLPREAESEGGRRPECLGERLARTPDQGRPACARNSHSDAGNKPQIQHRWTQQEPRGSWRSSCRRHPITTAVYYCCTRTVVGPSVLHTATGTNCRAVTLLQHPPTPCPCCGRSHQRQQSLTPCKPPRCSSLVRGPRGAAAGRPPAKGTQRAPRGHEGR